MSAAEPRVRQVRIGTAAGGGEVSFLDFGDPARPADVVFAHANGFNARAYRAILAPLADRLRILAPDLRGHGATTLPTPIEGRADWLDLRDDLIAFLDAADVGRAALAGHSMGGTTALLTAASVPERVRALTLFDPVVLWSRPRAKDAGPVADSPLIRSARRRRRVFPSREEAFRSYRGAEVFRTWPDEMLSDYVAAGFRDQADGTAVLACPPEWEASSYAAQGHDPWPAFEESRCPISILRAASGSTARLDEGLDALLATGRIRVETVPDTTHFLPMERPDLARAAILEAASA